MKKVNLKFKKIIIITVLICLSFGAMQVVSAKENNGVVSILDIIGNEIKKLSERLTSLENKVAQDNLEIDSLKDTIKNQQTEITNLKNQIEQLKNSSIQNQGDNQNQEIVSTKIGEILEKGSSAEGAFVKIQINEEVFLYFALSNEVTNAFNVGNLVEISLNAEDKIVKMIRIDKIDYPFVNDAEVVGVWKCIDFVQNIEQFNPEFRSWNFGLFYNNIVFTEGGQVLPWGIWTKGYLINAGERTASKYIIKEIGGIKYLFIEWKSGDYTFRNQAPHYYVFTR